MTPSLAIVSAILGIVEGLTEFIPISSTGHLIVFDNLLKFRTLLSNPEQADMFDIVIQLGAILAVGLYFRKRLVDALVAKSSTSSSGRLRLHLIFAFIPAAAVGFLFHNIITKYLFSPMNVAIAFIVGGIIIIIVERNRKPEDETNGVALDTMTNREAWIVGFAQILSLFPGVSRSGATIIGGMLGGMTRKAATEFSFLLSFPIMIAAGGYDLFKHRDLLSSDIIGAIGIGFLMAFISALIVVAWLIRFVERHSLIGFGYYRIAAGIVILILVFTNFF